MKKKINHHNIEEFQFPPLDDLRIDLIKAHGDTKVVKEIMEGLMELYKSECYPVSISTSQVKLKWI